MVVPTQIVIAAVACSEVSPACRGLRAGALPSVSISGDRYICTTKGPDQKASRTDDVDQVEKALGHANVGLTETHLRSPGQG